MKIICKNKDTIATGWVIANFPDDQPGANAGLGASFFVKAIYRLRPDEVPIPWADGPVMGSADIAIDGNPHHGISYAPIARRENPSIRFGCACRWVPLPNRSM
ncbi:MAG: hypothetical protein NTY25_01990 [Planctomycetia bacterium]|nr:hypothetical protein [Planctomycetia bacterium]